MAWQSPLKWLRELMAMYKSDELELQRRIGELEMEIIRFENEERKQIRKAEKENDHAPAT